MKNNLKISILLMLTLLLSSCLSQLKTREDLKGQTEISQPQGTVVVSNEAVASEEDSNPAPAYKQEERNSQIRALYGRVEESEHQVQELRQSMIALAESRQQEKEESAKKLQAYEEAIKELERQIQSLQGHQAATKSSVTKKSVKKEGSQKSTSEDFEKGSDLFRQKKWKEAIVSFQKYREDFPKGKMYPEATYKMGQSFLELGMKDESKSFFEEVRVKYPKSPLAKKAQKQLKSL